MRKHFPAAKLGAGLAVVMACCCASVVGMRRPEKGRESSIDVSRFVLTFCDEFDGDSLDETTWFTDPFQRDGQSKQHIINDEKQAYVREALEVRDGLLRIHVEKRQALYAGQMMGYTSGLISTRKGGFGQRYGYFEIRCRMPTARGLWPAFWLMPRAGNHPGSTGSEIDIMEFWPHKEQEQYSVNIHWGGYRESHLDDIYHIPVKGPCDSFHVYGAELTPLEVVFYFDRKEVARYSGPGVSHDFMHLIANCAVVEAGADDEALPDVFEIDFIRVYKRVHPATSSQTSLACLEHHKRAAQAVASVGGPLIGSSFGSFILVPFVLPNFVSNIIPHLAHELFRGDAPVASSRQTDPILPPSPPSVET